VSGGVRHVCVITSCTGSKLATAVPTPAEELYTGQHHLRLMRGVDAARRARVGVDVSIVSAGHGVVAGDRALLPYERTFQGLRAQARQLLARELEVPAGVRAALARPADLHLVLLGDDYLGACELDAEVRPSAPVVLLCSAGSALRLPPIPDVCVIALTVEDTRRFRCGLVALKGEIGGRVLEFVARTPAPAAELASAAMLDRLTDAARVPVAATLF
jgi:hypothetical protein